MEYICESYSKDLALKQSIVESIQEIKLNSVKEIEISAIVSSPFIDESHVNIIADKWKNEFE